MLFKILIFLFSTVLNLYSQDLKVSYSVNATSLYATKKPDTLPIAVQNVFKEAKKNFKFIEYTLHVKNNESLFFVNDKMLNDANRQMNIAIALAGFNGKAYTNSQQDVQLRNRDTYGQEFLVKSKFDVTKWNITNETKKIENYITYKATAPEDYISKGEKEVRQIEAWFAPEIQRPFGPLGYGNLPGLILELSVAGKTYTATNVENLSLNQDAVERPTSGKKISKKEFDDLGVKIYLERLKE